MQSVLVLVRHGAVLKEVDGPTSALPGVYRWVKEARCGIIVGGRGTLCDNGGFWGCCGDTAGRWWGWGRDGSWLFWGFCRNENVYWWHVYGNIANQGTWSVCRTHLRLPF